eukprot:scaffold36306_cov62-Phaeocystis_antarctica.AAC.7
MSVAVLHCGGGGGGGGGFAQPVTYISFRRKKPFRDGGGEGGGVLNGGRIVAWRHVSMSLPRVEVWPTAGATVPLSVALS